MTLLIVGLVSPCLAGQTLTIRGTGDSEKLLQKLGEHFEASHPGISTSVPPSIGSNGGIRALQAGDTDLARTARPLRDHERTGLLEIPFAKSPVVFAVNHSVSGISSLTFEEISAIYNLQIRNWQAVGGPDHKIYPVDREADDSSRSILKRDMTSFPGNAKAKVFFSVPEALAAVRKHKFTIGFFPLAATRLEDVKILKVNNISAMDPSYPFTNRFYIVSKGEPQGIAKQFVDYLFSPAAQKIMREFGVIPLPR